MAADRRGPGSEGELIVVGRVVGEGSAPILANAVFQAGEERSERKHEGHLAVDSAGRRLDVELQVGDLAEEVVEGRWGDVAESRLGRLFVDQAPGEHVKVRIAGAVLLPGDLIAIRAVAAVEEAVAGAGYRDAPSLVVTGVRGLRAARGDDEASARAALEAFDDEVRRRDAKRAHDEEARRHEAKLEKKRAAEQRAAAARAAEDPPEVLPWRWPLGIYIALSLGCAVWSGLATGGWNGVFPVGRGATLLWGISLVFLGAAVHAWTVRHDLPLVHEVGVSGRRRAHDTWAILQLCLVVIIVPLMIGGGRSKATPIPRAGIALTGCISLLLLGLTLLRTRRAVRWLWLIGRARRLPPGAPDSAWGLVEGTVRGAKEPLSAHSTLKMDGKQDILVTSTRAERELELETETGAVVVETARAIWSAPTAWRRAAGNSTAVSTVAVGDRVAVLGRVRLEPEGWRMRATGRESLFVIVGSPGGRLLRVLTPALAYLVFVGLIAALCLSAPF